MGLGGALYSGVSGIRAHQNMLDVIGNNLANINTYGYKSSRLLFSDLLSQTMSSGKSGNPMQIGKGVNIGSISSNFSQGTLETTNNALDFAIQGEGFFVVSGGDKDFFTRVGSFDTDADNFLIDSNTGYKVVDTTGSAITIPYDSTVSGKATSTASLTGNLDASAASGATHTTSVDVYDSLGIKHTVSLIFTKQGDNTWEANASMASTDGEISTSKISGITFNGDGTFSASGGTTLAFKFSGTSDTQSVIFNLGTSGGSDGLTQYGGNSTAAATSQDGYESGTFDSISVDSGGSITALYTNGITQPVATLKIALFNNLNGLSKQGNNLYAQTSASGEPIYVTAGSGSAGSISSGYLEGSNVDMATELTSLIIAQRGFQLNTKVITTADEVLSDIVNLKR